MFRTKICGITTVEDARVVADAGADAVGLNFFGKSARFIDDSTAVRLIKALPTDIVKVGLFVNATAAEILAKWDRLGLDLIQLHGDEPPEFLAELGDKAVMRAFRLGDEGLPPIRRYLDRCQELGCPPRLTLIDSFVKDAYGGTGKTADWPTAAAYAGEGSYPPLVLAGGLTPANVAEAIRTVRPMAVDTAGGVESSPGRKDASLAEEFVRHAVDALDSID